MPDLKPGLEMDSLVAKALGKPQRTVPPELADGECLKHDSELWLDIVQRAIDAEVGLEQSGAYKGVSYSAVFDGWQISYHLDYSDSYRADDSILIDGTPDRWRHSSGDYGLFIKPAPPPPFSTDPGKAIKALEEFCEKNNLKYVIDGNYLGRGLATVRLFTLDKTKTYVGVGMAEKLPLPHAICLAIVEAEEAGK